MKYQITLVERMILESLQIKPKNLNELNMCTKIEKDFIRNILTDLVSKNLIISRENKYQINKHLDQSMINELFNKDFLNVELMEMTQFCIKEKLYHKTEKAFKMKKVHMNEKEKKIYYGLLYNLESFLDSLEKKPLTTSDTTIHFWGEGNYGKIINHYINA